MNKYLKLSKFLVWNFSIKRPQFYFSDFKKAKLELKSALVEEIWAEE